MKYASLLYALLLVHNPCLGQPNPDISYHSFTWYMKAFDVRVDSTHSCAVQVWFPSSFDTTIANLAASLTQRLIAPYAATFLSLRPVRQPPPHQGELVRDETGQPRQATTPWCPERLVVILYPNAQDFNQQKIIRDEAIPPGVGGFTEPLQGMRCAVPYSGNLYWFLWALAHEVQHTFYCQYLPASHRDAADLDLPNVYEPASPPLWFIEGQAEYTTVKYFGDNQRSSRLAQLKEVNLIYTAHQKLPALDKFGRKFLNYSGGYSFFSFVPTLAESSQYITAQLARGRNIEAAWDSLGRELEDDEVAWRAHEQANGYQLTLGSPADSLPARELNPKLSSIGGIGYDRDSKYAAYFHFNETYDLEVVVRDLDSHLATVLAHQYEDKSRFYRVSNTPAVYGNTVALVTSRDGHDVLELYGLHTNGRGLHVTHKQAFTIPGLVWVDNVSFIDSDSLLFVGMDASGQRDVYTWNYESRRLQRLTNDRYDKQQPQYLRGDTLVYLESGSLPDRHHVTLLTPQGKTWLEFGGDTLSFPDQIKVCDGNVAVRLLRPNGSCYLVVWNPAWPQAYRYRFGTRVAGDSYVAFPLVTDIIGWQTGTLTLLVKSSTSLVTELDRWEEIPLDTAKLAGLAVTYRPSEPFTFNRSPATTELPSQPADRTMRYRTITRDRAELSDATGEHGIMVNQAQLFYLGNFGLFYRLEAGYFDRSGRPEVNTLASAGHSPWINGSLLSSRREDISLDNWAIAKRQYLYPLDPEQSVWWQGSIGYLVRTFDNEAHPSTTTPILGLGAGYRSDGVYGNPLVDVYHGTALTLALAGTVGQVASQYQLLDGSASLNFRWYWQPWPLTAYLACQVAGGFATGPYATNFFTPALAPQPGVLTFDYNRSVGSRLAVAEAEWRLPVARLFLTQYRFWEASNPLLVFVSLGTGWFYAAGAVGSQGTPLRFTSRTGLMVELSPFSGVAARYEYGTTFGLPGWQGSWNIRTTW